MKHFYFLPIIFTSLICPVLSAQDIAAYFSEDGLSINAFHYNFYDGTYSTSYTYHERDSICGEEVLTFIHNTNGFHLYLRVEGLKVYRYFRPNCDKSLLYDFSLQVGETISEGYYEGFTLVGKYPVALLNGEQRMRYDLTSGSQVSASWIEGIGDVEHGLIPFFADFEGYDEFVCTKKGNELLWINEMQAGLCDSLSCALPILSFSSSLNEFELSIGNNSIFASTFEWDFGDGTVSTAGNPTHVYEEPGCYALSVSVSNECHTGGQRFIENIPACFSEPWAIDYVVDTFDFLYVHRFSENLEFIHGWNGPNLHRTTDGGQNWVKITLPPVPAGVRRLIYSLKMFDDLNGVMACGHYGAQSNQKAILVTHDGGLNWEEKVPGSYFMLDVEVNEDGRAWAVGTSRRYYRSFDYGENWEEISFPYYFSIEKIQYIHDSLLIGRGYTGIQPGATYYLIKSNDDGLTWDTIPPPSNIHNWHFFDENVGYAISGQGIAVTTDGGLSATPIELDFSVRDFSFYNPEVGWLVDNTGLVHYTTDGMQTFSIGHCNEERVRHIEAISETEAFIVSSIAPGAINFSDYKKSFNLNVMPSDCIKTQEAGSSPVESSEITVYPNPFTNALNVEMSRQNVTLLLLNVLGKTMLENHYKEEEKIQLNLSGLPAGMYLLHILGHKNKAYTQKVIKH
ncbi:MAG: T9SS type A sorting domain-containing protein [Phaeodactylibacter sp.]|nr:T9SS type A sorting domain-containing protein [Phaeodactylibacter sp.]